ncbi:MAG: glutamine synthetase, partial [Chloroflexi bacterium]|nr:glutamine synthetase [Chloroflexota bacterium]
KDGKNAFYDPDSEDGLSDLAYACIAGQIDKHKSMSVICAPTVNAYKRLQPGQLSGYWANWGYDHRGVTIRVPHHRGKATRLENRMSDGAANPYLATAAVLQAARLGYLHKTELPAAEDRDCFESQSTEICTPANLHEACAALAADQEFSNALGAECVEGFLTVKEMEWEKYVEAVPNWEQLDPTDVSQWELDFYTPYL